MASLLAKDITEADLNIESGTSVRDIQIFEALKNPTIRGLFPGRDTKEIVNHKLTHAILFQIIMVQPISKSKLALVDELRRLNDPKSARVDRLQNSLVNEVNMDDNPPQAMQPTNSKQGVYKFALQDHLGDVFYATNRTALSWNNFILGSKVILKEGTLFNRGMFLMDHDKTVFLGGILQQWNQAKNEKTLEFLQTKLDADRNSMSSSSTSRKRKQPPS